MAIGHSGAYRGTVVDNMDPSLENRLLVVVPEVNVEPGWAKPAVAPYNGPVPGVGEEVVILFEAGDSEHPVWQSGVPPVTSGPAAGRFPGVYGATVVDNIDPTQAGRLQVSVPDALGYEPVWAAPSPAWGPGLGMPEIGSSVSVQFDGGDASHPVWMGMT